MLKGKATLIKELTSTTMYLYNSSASFLYRVEPPLEGNDHVVVSCVHIRYLREAHIFGSDEEGIVYTFCELPGSYSGDTDPIKALNRAGYEVEVVES